MNLFLETELILTTLRTMLSIQRRLINEIAKDRPPSVLAGFLKMAEDCFRAEMAIDEALQQPKNTSSSSSEMWSSQDSRKES